MPRVIKHEQYSSSIPFDFTPIFLKPVQKSSQKIIEDQEMDIEVGRSPESIMEEATLKADEIIAEAKRNAQEYLKEAHIQAEKEFDEQRKVGYNYGFEIAATDGQAQGYAKGYDDGLKKGHSDAVSAYKKETAVQIDDFKKMIMQFDLQKQKLLDETRQDFQFLAIAIARKIIKTELFQNPQYIENMIISSLESFKNQKWIRIRVSSQVAKILSQSQQTLNALSDDVKIIPCETMELDQCVIETSDGIIDAGVETQLNLIEDAFKKALFEQDEAV